MARRSGKFNFLGESRSTRSGGKMDNWHYGMDVSRNRDAEYTAATMMAWSPEKETHPIEIKATEIEYGPGRESHKVIIEVEPELLDEVVVMTKEKLILFDLYGEDRVPKVTLNATA
jgi:hypothetical protein